MPPPPPYCRAINFIAVDWPAQPWTGGSYTGARGSGSGGGQGLLLVVNCWERRAGAAA